MGNSYADGGTIVDPVSKNEVPAGATAKEVRDDVPVNASEGEYIIPANVVRYLGLDKIEKMINQAKKGLEELDAGGRIGGKSEDDLPFSPDELQAVDEGSREGPSPVKMAEGGVVTQSLNPALDPNSNERDPITGLPLWLINLQAQSAPAPTGVSTAPSTTKSTDTVDTTRKGSDQEQRSIINHNTGMALNPDQWEVKDFNNYAKSRDSVEQRMGQGLASVIPLGGLGAKMRQGYLERNVPTQMSKMLQSGKDLQGNDLSTEQLQSLRDSYAHISNNPLGGGVGVSAIARKAVANSGLIKQPSPESNKPGLLKQIVDAVTGKSSKTDKPLVERKAPTKSESTKSPTKTEKKSTTKSSSKSTSSSSSSKTGNHGGGR